MHKIISAIILLALSSVSVNAFSADEDDPERDTMAATVMVRCDAITGNGVEVVSASSSVELDLAVIQIFPPENDPDCAEALAKLLNLGFKLRSITSGSAQNGEDEDGDLRLYTDYLLIGRVPTDI